MWLICRSFPAVAQMFTLKNSLGALNSVLFGSGLLTPDIMADGYALLSARLPARCVQPL